MRLLISVTDAAEAVEAAAGGADIIDVKDPGAGALGQASPECVAEVRRVVPAGRPVTAALGDGPFEPSAVARQATCLADSGATYVKLGVRNTTPERVLTALRVVRASLPPDVGLIVAGFADWERAGAPRPLDLPDLARSAGARGCLVDTAVKDGRGLFRWLDEPALRALVLACRRLDLMCGLAGSLGSSDLARVAGLVPDIVGIRGAACAGDRVHGRVQADRVAGLARILRGEAVGPTALAAAT